MTKIYVVMGASGQIGHHLVEHLSKKNHKIKALGRDEKRLARLKGPNVETIAIKDFSNENALAEAFKGADALFALIPPAYDAEDLAEHQKQVSKAIDLALKKHPIKFIVNLSSLGADHPSGTGPITGLHHQEERFNAFSDINVLHLRCAYFMENLFWSIPVIKQMDLHAGPLDGDLPIGMVATKDIGKKAAEFLDNLNFKGHQIFDFVGPKDITMREVTKIIGNAIGKPSLRYLQAPYSQIEKGMIASGMKPKTVKLMIEMYKAINDKRCEPTQVITPDHRGQTTLEEFAKVFAGAYNQEPSTSSV